MISFLWPWVFLVVPLPWLVRRLLSVAPPAGQGALRVPFIEELDEAGLPGRERAVQRRALWLAVPAWLLLVTAAARPQWLGDTIELPVSGRDLMLAVDISGSMQTRDFRLGDRLVDRLSATKWVASDFIARRKGDRLGLILFGRRAYVQTPLTFDLVTVQTLLREAEVGFAGKETAIGDAIGLAIKRLRQNPEGNRVVILLTDGANTAGEVDPYRAAELAGHEGLKIYTVGIGSDSAAIPALPGMQRFFPSTELDESTLKAIASATGGQYFRARNTQELARIYDLLDELEPLEQEVSGFRPVRSLYPWPLGLAAALGLGLVLAHAGPGFASGSVGVKGLRA